MGDMITFMMNIINKPSDLGAVCARAERFE
jgi:hypothetical protein